MFIQQIINGLCCKVIGNQNPQITSLSCDTSTVKQGCLFFCLKGQKYDGHNFVGKAIGDGAVAIVCERPLDTKVLQIVVDDVRSAMSLCAKNFYQNVCDKIKLIAVVGTNGKTSTSYILQKILQNYGYNTGLIGTNGIYFNDLRLQNELTTPDPIDLHRVFYQMYLNKVQYVVIEVSAHAIALNKVAGLTFDMAIFTNFTQDHLDFFQTMERYAEVKKSFFDTTNVKNAVINIDDTLGKEIYLQMPSVCYALDNVADGNASCIQTTTEGYNLIKLTLFDESFLVKSALQGRFNIYNILAASTCASALGVDANCIANSINQISTIEGRNQTITRDDGLRIVVDFAHTPDGIENILKYLKDTTQGQLIVVFGCGGNRDKFKRPLMAQVVSKYADSAVVTNDNPRYENPQVIARDISDCLTCKHKVILNRSQATAYALSIASNLDTVAILGKGAETYQDIKGKKYPYSDIETIKKLISN